MRPNRSLYLLLALIFFVALLVSAAIYISGKKSEAIAVYQDGVYSDYRLTEESVVFKLYDKNGGYNEILIEDYSVRIIDADCPDRLCVKQGVMENGPLVCLPHRLVVRFENDDGSADGVSR